MTFGEMLNDYISRLGCTAKQLSGASGLSGAVISRYRTGQRQPDADSDSAGKLISGIVLLAKQAEISDITTESVSADFSSVLPAGQYDSEKLTHNLNALISVLNISVTELARTLNFDASYLSRIRSGSRRPADMGAFIGGVSRFVVRRYTADEQRAVIAELIGAEPTHTADDSVCCDLLATWLSSGTARQHDYMGDFLKKLDDFNLDEYIRAIRFDELKVPSVPFLLPASRTYYGIEQMKLGELDFFKSTVLSKSSEPVFMCSDMPLEDMAADLEFGKKWMFAIAMMLKKGLHLNIIHDIDRPFGELMLGLESWIPIYMTGQISPYYLRSAKSKVYCHLNYSSGSAALEGECVSGSHNNGRYYLTRNKEEVAYSRKKTADLLAKAHPLMEIYRSDSENAYRAFIRADAQTVGNRHNILSCLPLYTASQQLLTRILDRNNIATADRERLLAQLHEQKSLLDTVLSHSTVLDEVAQLSQDEFEKYPMPLSLPSAFFEAELLYTYEEYLEHLRLTQAFASSRPNYTVRLTRVQVFRNIRIMIHSGKCVIISKSKTPAIHFVIRHSKMISALENFVVPVME